LKVVALASCGKWNEQHKRTVARKSSIGGFTFFQGGLNVCAVGLERKNSIYL